MNEVSIRQLSQDDLTDRNGPTQPDFNLQRPRVRGKFIYVNDEKFWVRGVTYGAFRPDANGREYHDLKLIEKDFAQMAASGMNAVRIPHTMPPRALLDIAQQQGLRVMVGLSAEQYIGYLIDKKGAPDIEELMRAKVRTCARHPALLCYAIGNELPATLVRWLGRHRVEDYLKRVYQVIQAEDPEGLVTYVNYPTTEYLQLPFLDFVSFNVYLETQERLSAYLARLQHIAGDRPLLMSELGLDAFRNSEALQASVLDWQIRTTFAAGCIGAFIFSWTDEWYRGGADVDDWAFGLTDQNRHPKPALEVVRNAFAEIPFPKDLLWPRISVIVCSYNGARTIRNCFEGLVKLEYPNYEVIVVDDGSVDETAAIAQRYNFRLIRTENRGLSNARNTGLHAALGEIVAYIDDDAYPDPHWLTYLAIMFETTDYAGIGGPNLAPADDGPVADCVANAPGGPIHVLLNDCEAEHIPGCNMAFRRTILLSIDGFDPQFRTAGDDVDVCWRLQQHGWKLGFSPAAMVWHHRRSSVRTYWKQQSGYGKAESLLEKKWPHKYNKVGHLTWGGRVYGKGVPLILGRVSRIYHGVWGSAPFQSIYQPSAGTWWSLLLMPEWYLVIACLAVLSTLGLLWSPMLAALPLLGFAIGAPMVQACLNASRAQFTSSPASRRSRFKLRALTAGLHLLQPLARLTGRLRYGLVPWRRRHGSPVFVFPRLLSSQLWSDLWQEPSDRLKAMEKGLHAHGAIVARGGDWDRWDLEIRGGLFGNARAALATEDHGQGYQLVRVRLWPSISRLTGVAVVLFAALATLAALDQAWLACLILGAGAVTLASGVIGDCAKAYGLLVSSSPEYFDGLKVYKSDGQHLSYAKQIQMK
jgi:GT2 family glycosyltransferase